MEQKTFLSDFWESRGIGPDEKPKRKPKKPSHCCGWTIIKSELKKGIYLCSKCGQIVKK